MCHNKILNHKIFHKNKIHTLSIIEYGFRMLSCFISLIIIYKFERKTIWKHLPHNLISLNRVI